MDSDSGDGVQHMTRTDTRLLPELNDLRLQVLPSVWTIFLQLDGPCYCAAFFCSESWRNFGPETDTVAEVQELTGSVCCASGSAGVAGISPIVVASGWVSPTCGKFSEIFLESGRWISLEADLLGIVIHLFGVQKCTT